MFQMVAVCVLTKCVVGMCVVYACGVGGCVYVCVV